MPFQNFQGFCNWKGHIYNKVNLCIFPSVDACCIHFIVDHSSLLCFLEICILILSKAIVYNIDRSRILTKRDRMEHQLVRNIDVLCDSHF